MEQKKGFMEEGGGFDRIWDGTVDALRRFRDTKYGLILGALMVAIVTFTFLMEPLVQAFQGSFGNFDSKIVLHREAGLPEAAGLTEVEFAWIADDLGNVAGGWFSEKTIESFKEKFGYNPYSEQEMRLLLESSKLFYSLDSFMGWEGRLIRCLGFPIGGWMIGKKRKVKYWFVSALAGIAAVLIPVVYLSISFTRDFRGTMLFICDMLFSVDCRVFSPENSLLARLMPESVLRGIVTPVLYESMKVLACIVGIMLVIWLIVYLVDKSSKREKEDNANESSYL